MAKTFEIIKTRWQEVVLIVGLGLLGSISHSQVFADAGNYKDINVMAIILPIVFVIFFTLFKLGFLRTAYLNNNESQTPVELLKAGKNFFWRIFAFNIFFAAACLLIVTIFFAMFGYLTEKPWLSNLFFVMAIVILVKPFLFLPAIIIITDCKFTQSFRFLKRLKLATPGELLLLFVIFLALTFSTYFLPDKSAKISKMYYVYKTAFYTAFMFVEFTMKLSAVKFASCILEPKATVNAE